MSTDEKAYTLCDVKMFKGARKPFQIPLMSKI